jgi:saccharopine dehydrogenase-like NADP-dependent oxidoreductase
MQSILVIGAGRSTESLLNYLGRMAESKNWDISIADINGKLASSKAFKSRMQGFQLDISDSIQLKAAISGKQLVVSMLPAHLHGKVARECVSQKVHMATASYLSEEIKALDSAAKEAGITLLNELGLDPGLDHLSAMSLLDQIRDEGGSVEEFESFTGGLVAPESDNNPWNYKFTWNPRNVVLAGQGGAVKFIQEGKYKYIPYPKVFRRTELIEIEGYGRFEGYANRDSLKYRETYGLQDVKTMFRGTLRRVGFCKCWNYFVVLGATDDSYSIEHSEGMSFREFINTFLPYSERDSVELKLRQYLKIDQDDVEEWEKLNWLDIFSDHRIPLKNASPAKILEYILMRKWSLDKGDKDMIVMWHKVQYREASSIKREKHLSLVCIGDDDLQTAMAKTVGLPLAVGCELILDNKLKEYGAILPIKKSIYKPILTKLKTLGIEFIETQVR